MCTRLKASRIAVTGAGGFIGSALMPCLQALGSPALAAIPRSKCDLRVKNDAVALMKELRPDIVIHLAACHTGLGAREIPGELIYDNVTLDLNVLEACRLAGVRRIVALGSAAIYPASVTPPYTEEMMLCGPPAPEHKAYALSKRVLHETLQAYQEQYGLNSICLILSNVYGPRDCFGTKQSPVIPAMIAKTIKAKQSAAPAVEFWGNGLATRDFIYVDDVAAAVMAAVAAEDVTGAVNVGSGLEVQIASVATIVCEQVGYTGLIEWDSQQPSGSSRHCLDISKARKLLAFEPVTRLKPGVRQTLNWYLSQHADHAGSNLVL